MNAAIFRHVTFAVLAALAPGGCALVERRAPDSRTGISRMERVALGGFPQAIRIRGDDRFANPVLLFVHGGPGLPEMPVAHRNAGLERLFTVVQWDQRGTGKSFRLHTPDLSAERIVSDTLELSRDLRRRFGGRKIYIAGYSWGSLVAARAVAREPELFAAYIGISQLVNIPDAERTIYAESLAKARHLGMRDAVRDLERAGPPPWKSGADLKRVKQTWSKVEGPLPNRMTPARFIAAAIASPAITPWEIVTIPLGAKRSYQRLKDAIYAADLSREIPRVEVPVWFVMGRHDTVVSDTVLARYFATLHAPRGKRLVWFENSAHAPHLEEPDKFRATMRDIRAATFQKRTN